MVSFIGGIHPPYKKITATSSIEVLDSPSMVVVPLSQHIGAPAKLIVKKGDIVHKGQKIAEASSFVSANIHSPVSGKIKQIGKYPHPVKAFCEAVVIETDDKDELDPSIKKRDNIESLSRKELLEIIKDAGIVGMGGATFPTHVKLSPPKDKVIDTLFLNGAECEPYLTCDHRLMVEETQKILDGLKIAAKILDVHKCYIGIEKNKPDAIEAFQDINTDDWIEICPLEVKYPQGAEKMLIYAISGRRVPAGGLPMDAGTVVLNVGTAKAIYDAVYEGIPLLERVVTVTGGVNIPKNLKVGIGTSAKVLIDAAGGATGKIRKIIAGGPMMGIAQDNLDFPVIKGTSGIVLQLESHIPERDECECIRCGRCVDACPMSLQPNIIARLARKERFDEAAKYHAMDCFECGCCAYRCPSKIPLVHWIKYAKDRISRVCKR